MEAVEDVLEIEWLVQRRAVAGGDQLPGALGDVTGHEEGGAAQVGLDRGRQFDQCQFGQRCPVRLGRGGHHVLCSLMSWSYQ